MKTRRDVLQAISDPTRREIIESLPHSRPMPTIGARCHELRIIDGAKNWRIIYRIDGDAIVVLECFKRKRKRFQNLWSTYARRELNSMIVKEQRNE
jgi:phage-related protein